MIVSIIIGCSKEDSDIRLSNFETPIVTGFIYRDGQGSELGVYGGIPNVKLYEGNSHMDSKYSLSIFPNPCSNKLGVVMKLPDNNSIKKIWIVKAQYLENNENPNNDLGIITKEIGGSPLAQVESTSRIVSIDVSSLPEGCYRVYTEVDNLLFYDNLLISKSIYY